MYTFLIVVHILIALVLMVVVLMQSGKGGGLGAGFGGGGANTLFGSSGGSNFFTKLTMSLAAAFMITSLGLTMVKGRALRTSIFDQSGAAGQSAPATPAQGTTPPQTPGQTVPPSPATPRAEAPPSQPTGGEAPAQPGAVPLAQPGVPDPDVKR